MRQASNRGMIRFGLLQHEHSFSADDYQYFVARLQVQGFARFTRDDNLVLGGKGGLRHRFTS